MAKTLRPITITEAKAFIARWHRHNLAPVSALFAVAVEDGDICGVATVGRPSARALQDGFTAEITRVATDGSYNACSMLYGACRRAARALGYRRLYTYTLAEESGASLRAAGFIVDQKIPARVSWSTPSRPRQQTDLFGKARRPAQAKVRWLWQREAPDGQPGRVLQRE